MRIFLLFLIFQSTYAYSRANVETHNFDVEYGLAYHTLKSTQKDNDARGRLTSPQLPYVHVSYTYRITPKFGIKAFGGYQTLRFNKPTGFGTLDPQFDSLSSFGLEIINKTGPNSKFGIFFMQQDRPLYRAINLTDFEVLKIKFGQAGAHWQLGQRRRIGLLWGVGLKAYTLFPTIGGNVATDLGIGGEAYARLGWVGPLGTLHQAKAFYQGSTAPNSEVVFTHEVFGYAYQVSLSF